MTDLSTVPTDQLFATLETVVEEFGPDFKYDNPLPEDERDARCQYVHGAEPGCIVGHVLHRLGVSLEDMREYEGQGADTMSYKFGVPYIGRRFLESAQTEQDTGGTWGDALRSARHQYALNLEDGRN